METEKPPIGIIPREIHKQHRALELTSAVHRYVTASMPVPREWLQELIDLYATEQEAY